jgi:hypothetical protein
VSEIARAIVRVLVIALAVCAGWFGRGLYDGSTVSKAASAAQAQDAVTVGAGETVRIVDASRQTADAAERVRYITRTVEVAPECPPGRGAVSAELADELREAIK